MRALTLNAAQQKMHDDYRRAVGIPPGVRTADYVPPVAAYDSRRGLARDDDIDKESEEYQAERLHKHRSLLKAKIGDLLTGVDDNARAEIEHMLDDLAPTLSPPTATDEPPDFPGRPRVGGGMTGFEASPQYKAARDFFDRRKRAGIDATPEAMASLQRTLDEIPEPATPAMDTAFAKKFPGAADIRIAPPYGPVPAPRSLPRGVSDATDFARRYPGTVGIKVM